MGSPKNGPKEYKMRCADGNCAHEFTVRKFPSQPILEACPKCGYTALGLTSEFRRSGGESNRKKKRR